MLKRKLWRVYAHYLQALARVLGVPRFNVRECALTVDATVGPEVHEHYFFALKFAKRYGETTRVDKATWVGYLWSLLVQRVFRRQTLRGGLRYCGGNNPGRRSAGCAWCHWC